jgi:hypothetical protein
MRGSVEGVLPSIVAIVLLLVAAGLAGAQLVIPRIAQARIRERLTAGGGEAEVAIRAVPASRLLRNQGDGIVVRGRGLVIGLASGEGEPGAPGPTSSPGLTALDGFTDVDIELVDFRTGPFSVSAFVLSRAGAESYAMATRATTTAAELARFGLDRLGSLPGAGLIGTIAGPTIGGREIAVSVEIELISEGGALRVGAGGGSIAGYPAGPLATTIAAAVARRLEIVP